MEKISAKVRGKTTVGKKGKPFLQLEGRFLCCWNFLSSLNWFEDILHMTLQITARSLDQFCMLLRNTLSRDVSEHVKHAQCMMKQTSVQGVKNCVATVESRSQRARNQDQLCE